MIQIEFDRLSKSFGSHSVLRSINATCTSSEVIALMGENGAGKTTLMRILSGVYPYGSYQGAIRINSKTLAFHSVRDAHRAGVVMIHQELGLFSELTAAENIMLDSIRESRADRFAIAWEKIYTAAQDFMDSLGFAVNVRKKVSELSAGTRQLVEIARALHSNADVLIFDEPTSALTQLETEQLFLLIEKLRSEGKCIFYVSHRMDEIMRIATRVLVLRDGELVANMATSQLTKDQIISAMVGRDVSQIYPERKPVSRQYSPVLSIKNLSLTRCADQKELLRDISLNVWPGEVLGIGGLMGAGRSELALALYGAFGKNGIHRDQYEVIGAPYSCPQDAIRGRVGLVTEDRKLTGLLLGRSAVENISLTALAAKKIQLRRQNRLAARMGAELKVRGPGLEQPVQTYSGGNQQKVAIAKCLAAEPRVLILDEPTRGVDINSKIEIYEMIAALTRQGIAIILVSSEMPELLGLSDRVIVLREGRISGEFENIPTNTLDPEKVMYAASL